MIAKSVLALAGGLFAATTGAALAGSWDWPADREHAFYERFSTEHTVAPPAGVEIEVGGLVPPSVELYEAPADFDYAPARTYRYVTVQHRIYVVEPTTRRVIHIIER